MKKLIDLLKLTIYSLKVWWINKKNVKNNEVYPLD
jgi:hypothetical protein